jgi:membrane protein DedA with SNARE-associated domain
VLFESVQQLAEWMQGLPPLSLYLVLLGIAYGENVLPPVPGDVAIVIGGYLIGLGLISFVPALVLCSLASTLGFMTMYAIGKALGDAVEDPKRVRWIPKGPVRLVKRWLQRWGYGVVAANRFLSGGRAVIALLSGASDLRVGWTFVLATLSATIWIGLLLYAGYEVGANWESILPILRTYGRVITAVLVLIVAVVVGRWWWRRRYGKTASEPDAPRNREDPDR